MHKFIAKYAVAAHLAFTAVAPLFLLPFFTVSQIAVVELWLAFAGAVWVMMAPSCRMGESLPMARRRLFGSLVKDPLFWTTLLFVIFALVQLLNTGIARAYDPELNRWSISPAPCDFLPGSAKSESAFLMFSAALAMLVLVIGLGHGLGKNARLAFAVSSSSLAAVGGIVAILMMYGGDERILKLIAVDYSSPLFPGVAYGIWLLVAVSALFGVIEAGWMSMELLVAVALIGNAAGLYIFAPALDILVFAGAVLVLVIFSFIVQHHELRGAASLRSIIMILAASVLPILASISADGGSVLDLKTRALLDFKPFDDGFFALRDCLNALAQKIWREAPLLGGGLDSFPIRMRFLATDADWALVRPWQTAVPCGWWQLLCERGVVGAAALALPVAASVWNFGFRAFLSRAFFPWRALHIVGLLALAAVTAVSFFDASLLRPEAFMALISALVLGAAGVPRKRDDSAE